jgi:Family of unknown function (DUF6279)
MFLSVVLLGLTACSAMKVAYNNVDLYVLWKAEDYFALDSRQRALLKAELDSTSEWHRSNELDQYAALLVAARERAGSGISEADIEWFLTSARLRYEALARQSAPGAAAVLGSLTPAQIARFEAKLRRENDEFAGEYVEPPPEAQRRQRSKRTLELMDEWVGPLSKAQRSRMESLSFDLPLTNALRHADRQRRQQALIAILKQPGAPGTLAPALESWMIDWDAGRALEYEALSREARRRTVSMVLELDRSLTPAQRARLQARLARYAGEFDSLAGTRAVRMAAAGLSARWGQIEVR